MSSWRTLVSVRLAQKCSNVAPTGLEPLKQTYEALLEVSAQELKRGVPAFPGMGLIRNRRLSWPVPCHTCLCFPSVLPRWRPTGPEVAFCSSGVSAIDPGQTSSRPKPFVLIHSEGSSDEKCTSFSLIFCPYLERDKVGNYVNSL